MPDCIKRHAEYELLDRQAAIETRLARLESGTVNTPAARPETSIDVGAFANAICDL
jgi:hypothetical protein